jgi:hypothetical protein
MTDRDPKLNLAVHWMVAAASGLLVGVVPLTNDHPPARLLAVALVIVALPFGLRHPASPWQWGLVIAWPTATLRFSQAGWHSIFLLVYSIFGAYAGAWIAQWWSETHPPVSIIGRSAAAESRRGPVAADGSAVAVDGLPPQMPDRH